MAVKASGLTIATITFHLGCNFLTIPDHLSKSSIAARSVPSPHHMDRGHYKSPYYTKIELFDTLLQVEISESICMVRFGRPTGWEKTHGKALFVGWTSHEIGL